MFISFSLPWNQQILLGWVFEIIFTGFAGISYFLIYSTFLAFFIAICDFHRAFYEYFRATIDKINNIDFLHGKDKTQYIKLMLCKSIRFHTMAKK